MCAKCKKKRFVDRRNEKALREGFTCTFMKDLDCSVPEKHDGKPEVPKRGRRKAYRVKMGEVLIVKRSTAMGNPYRRADDREAVKCFERRMEGHETEQERTEEGSSLSPHPTEHATRLAIVHVKVHSPKSVMEFGK